MFRFASQNMLYLLILCVIFIVLLFFYTRRRKRNLAKFGSWDLVKELAPQFSRKSPVYKALFFIAALFFLILALARPQFGERKEVVRKEGIEIMIALDISNSMLAEDIVPNRLERAKYALNQLVDKLGNDKLGLVVFAGDAFVQLPMTHDYSAAKLFVSTISPDLISEQGTSISSAINLAATSFTTDSEIGKAIIIITDGEDHESDAALAAKKANEKGIQIFTIGMGLEKGAPVPLPRSNGSFIKDEQGNTVISKLNPDYLKKIAKAANGTYIQASNTNIGLNDILKEINRLNTEKYESTEFTAHAEQFQYFIGMAIILLIIGIIFPERRHTSWAKYNIFKTEKMNSKQLYTLIFILVGLGLSSCSLSDNERKMVRKGNKAYQDSIFDEAEVLYREALDFKPTSFAANYNLANATYKQNKFKSATKKYKHLLDSLETKEWKASANHNLGNSYLHSKEIDKAIEAYKESLRNNPDDKETKYNLVYAMNLKQQQQNQQQQQQQNKDQKQQNNQGGGQNQDQKSQQNNEPKDGDKETKPQKPQQGDEEQGENEQEKQKSEDKDDKGKENKEKGDQEDKKDGEEKDKRQGNPQKPQEETPDKNSEQRQVPVGISKEDAENLLDAIAIEEKEAQEKVQKDKARKAGRVRNKKNW